MIAVRFVKTFCGWLRFRWSLLIRIVDCPHCGGPLVVDWMRAGYACVEGGVFVGHCETLGS